MKELLSRQKCDPKDFCFNIPKAGRYWTGSEMPPDSLKKDKVWTQKLLKIGGNESQYVLELLQEIARRCPKNEQLRKLLSANQDILDVNDPDTPADIQILKNIFISSPNP